MAHSKHFTEKELSCQECGVNRTTSQMTRALEELRELVGGDIVVHSAYHCTSHPLAACGEQSGRHLFGSAADIEVEGMDVRTLYDFVAQVATLRGVGVNDEMNFIHVEIRTDSARWCYGPKGKVIPWYNRRRNTDGHDALKGDSAAVTI